MADKDKPITIGGKTYKNRAEFNKFVRGIGLPSREDAEKGKGIFVASPGGDPTNVDPKPKDGRKIKRTKQIREEFAKKPGLTLKKQGPAIADPKPKTPTKEKPKKLSTRQNPLKDKPRSISAARAAGEKYFYDKDGEKKLAVTGAELKKKGMTLKEWANTFAKKKQTKKDAESLKAYAKDKKLKKNPANKRAGGVMKKKTYAAGGRTTMKKQTMRGGGMMKKKTYAKGGKVLKMRGGGLATRGTKFRIR
tara:strand:+ start:797 stop:1543 length:747 start_codon:yes stop_codon:yes gene_type:complete